MTSPSLAATPVRERTRVVTPVPATVVRVEPALGAPSPPGGGSPIVASMPGGAAGRDSPAPAPPLLDDGVDPLETAGLSRSAGTGRGTGEGGLLPDPRPLAETLARCVVEVLAGTRDIDQIARWLSTDVHAHLMKRVVLARRARALRDESPGRLTFTMGSTVLCEPSDGVVEAVVIVHGRARSRAVALRLEALGSRWRASAVHVL